MAKIKYPLALSEGGKHPLKIKESGKHQKGSKPDDGKVKQMSPEKFLKEARPLKKSKEAKKSIKNFKHDIQSGLALGPLRLYADGTEDGRHRATAAKELGIKELPVIDFRAGKAFGGALGSDDPNRFMQDIMKFSFQILPLLRPGFLKEVPKQGFAQGGHVLEDEYPTEYLPDVGRQVMADGGVSDIEAAIRAAEEVSKKKEASHEKGVSGAVEFAPIEIEEPLTRARLPLGSLPKETARVVEPALQAASEIAPYFTPAAPIAAARDVAVGLREGEPSTVALSALGLPGKAAKAAAISASAFMPEEAEAGPIDKALSIARRLTESGHYSPAAEAATALKQEKGPASQMIGGLKNLPGVKPEEIKWSGIESAFHPDEQVTRQQIMDYLHENVPKVEETRLGQNRINLVQNEEEPHIFQVYHAGDPEGAHYGQVGEIIKNPAGRYQINVPGLSRHNFATLEEAKDYVNRVSDIGSTTKYGQYTLPGGENYREVLLHLPENEAPYYKDFESWFKDNFKPSNPTAEAYSRRYALQQWEAANGKIPNYKGDNNYASSHWDEPNVLGHLRMSDRTGPEGEKILHLEELQSDWAQEGRKKGFKASNEESRLSPQESEEFQSLNVLPDSVRTREQETRLKELYKEIERKKSGLPAAPYVTNTQHWTDLGLKRALREAAEGGYDKMIWTPGAEQAARYDLSKQIDRLVYNPNSEILMAYKDGKQVINRSAAKNELEGIVGKDVAKNLLAAEGKTLPNAGSTKYHILEGQDLSVGGEGMQSFYDKIVPTQLSKLIKKLDPKARIEMGGHKLKGKEGDVDAHVLHITPELRKRLLEGLPAYAEGGSVGRDGYVTDGSVDGEEENSPGLVDRALNFVSQFNPVGTAEAGPLSTIDKAVKAGIKAAQEVRAARIAGSSWEKMTPEQRKTFMSYPDKSLGNVSILEADPNELLRQERAHEQGYSGPWYHGTQRLDRLLEGKGLDPKRATSGPMPYFTDDPKVASNYAVGKEDTSRKAIDEGNTANYFTVNPKELGFSGKKEIPVEQTWHYLPQEIKQKIAENAKRIGYANPEEAEGPLTLHPDRDATIAPNHYDWILKNEHKGNHLSALRDLWHDSGELYNDPGKLEEVYRLAGYPYSISQKNAPWTESQGVLPAMIRMENPLTTHNVKEINEKVIPHLEKAFSKDRSKKTTGYNTDMWDKNYRYTPKEWVAQLKEDMEKGNNSMAWTSIPDKITKQLIALGYDGIIDTGGKMGGEGHRVAIPFHPHQVRSKFAKFDPKHIGKSDLMKHDGGTVIEEALDVVSNLPQKRGKRDAA